MTDYISGSLKEAHQTLEKFIADDKNLKLVQKGIEFLSSAYNSGNKTISCGNGGSMCDSMHFAEELTGRFRKDRRALPSVAISDPSHLSCVANDFGYEAVFSRYVEAWGNKGDVLLAISTSGNSPNIIKAVEAAKKLEMKVIGLLGKDGGKLKSLVDVPLIVPSQTSDRVQEIHIKLIHIFIEGIERSLFPENY